MSSRRTSYTACLARLVLFPLHYALVAPFVPALRELPFLLVMLWAVIYSALILASVRILRQEFLVAWMVASIILDFFTIALAQWFGPGAYLQVLYLLIFGFYITALGRAMSMRLVALPVGLVLAVDWAAGRLPDLLPLDLGIAGMITVMAWAVGGLADDNRQLRQRLSRAAMTDGLTELFNARYFFQRLTQELARAMRTGEPVTVALLDADGFKAINDTLGHLAGDRVLRACGLAMANAVRGSDVPVRYGGDEFALILPGVTASEAIPVVQRAAAAMTAAAAAEVGGKLSLRFSYGVADSRAAENAERLFSLADEHLYQAKRRGATNEGQPDASGTAT